MIYILNNKNNYKNDLKIDKIFLNQKENIYYFSEEEILSSLSLTLSKSFSLEPKKILLKIDNSQNFKKEINAIILNLNELRNNINLFIIVIDDTSFFENKVSSSNIIKFEKTTKNEIFTFLIEQIKLRNIFLNKENFSKLLSLNNEYWIINELDKIVLSKNQIIEIKDYNDFNILNNLFESFIYKKKLSFLNNLNVFLEFNEPFLIINSFINYFQLIIFANLDKNYVFKNNYEAIFLKNKIDLYNESWNKVFLELIHLKNNYLYSKSKILKDLIRYKLIFLLNNI